MKDLNIFIDKVKESQLVNKSKEYSGKTLAEQRIDELNNVLSWGDKMCVIRKELLKYRLYTGDEASSPCHNCHGVLSKCDYFADSIN